MGQVLGFAHCKESPSTASTTPDSTDGGNDESDFPELQTAREFSEDEEDEVSVDWGTPRELTFSYITFAGGPDTSPPSEPGPRGRRDSLVRRARGPLPRPETCETLVPMLGDSLENIPSLCQSPEGEQGLLARHCQGLEPFLAWDAPLSYMDDPIDLGWEEPQTAAAETVPGDLPQPEALTPHPAGDATEPPQTSATPSPWEEEPEAHTESITEQQLEGLDQSGNTLGLYIIGEPPMKTEMLCVRCGERGTGTSQGSGLALPWGSLQHWGLGRGIALRKLPALASHLGHCCEEVPEG
uniref:Uncharacterized protein n=1 Tax=Pelusios castaneus TaxID=367368 RepID=A0A8C8STI1_9SAUR